MTTTATRTGYAKIDRVVKQARDAGLQVEVSVEYRENELLGTQVSVAVDIRHPRLELVQNALEMCNQAERISLFWCWFVGNGATPRLGYANYRGWLGTERKLQAREIKYCIESMVDSWNRQEALR